MKLNLETDGIQFFIEAVSYGFGIHNTQSTGSISIGVAGIDFL
jgi:hypothetical protein